MSMSKGMRFSHSEIYPPAPASLTEQYKPTISLEHATL